MIYLVTFAFALALVASALAAAALITLSRRMRALALWQSRTVSDLQKLVASMNASREKTSAALRELQGQTPAKLAAEVAELSDAVAKLADTHRRFAGKVWAHIGERKAPPVANGDIGDVDGELQAMLALQTSGPVRPQ